MKCILLLLLLFTIQAFAAFTPFPPVVTPPDVVVTKGGLLTSTGVAQAENSGCADGEIIEWDSAEANGLKCLTNPAVASIPNLTLVTTTYTALVSDNVISGDASGAAFTITLYTAVGNTGRILEIKKSDLDFTNVITIDGSGVETIGGALTTTLDTEDENLRIQSNGANWVILNRSIPAFSFTYVPAWSATVNASSSGIGRRDRNYLVLDLVGSFTGANSQNVDLNFSLPTGLTIDTAELKSTSGGLSMDGRSSYNDSGSGTYDGIVVYGGATSVLPKYGSVFGTAILQNGMNPLSSKPAAPVNGDLLRVYVRVPINEWNK